MWWSLDAIHVMLEAGAACWHFTALNLAFQVVCRQAAQDDLALSKIFVSVLEYTYHRMQSHPTQGGISTCEALLDECLQVLASQGLGDVSASLERRLGLLLEYLRKWKRQELESRK